MGRQQPLVQGDMRALVQGANGDAVGLAAVVALQEAGAGRLTHLDILVERANGRVPNAFWTVFGDIEQDYETRTPR